MESQGKVHLIWNELQRQLDEKGYKIKRGVIQDASFITTDPGHAPADTPSGDQAKTRRSRDGRWGKKGVKSEFGFKLHSLIDTDHQLICRFDTTSAATHDNQVDLSEKGETVYRDKGYFGVKPFASIDKNYETGCQGKTSLNKRETKKPGNKQDSFPRRTTICRD